jgi:hypothetical protein
MPLIFRAMLADGDKPMLGASKRTLGACIGSGPNDDISVDEQDCVHPGTGGMSISPSADRLPMHRIPRRLKERFPDRFAEATGSNRLWIWSMGEGPFEAGQIADRLDCRPDPARPEEHGFVEPAQVMPQAEYQAALAATRDSWQRWEEDT